MIYLVDTSAWMPFLRRESSADWLEGPVRRGLVGIHDHTLGELALAGAPPERFSGLHRVAPVQQEVVLALVEQVRPRGVGWIDVHLVAAARVHGLRLVSADREQQVLARAVGVPVDEIAR